MAQFAAISPVSKPLSIKVQMRLTILKYIINYLSLASSAMETNKLKAYQKVSPITYKLLYHNI